MKKLIAVLMSLVVAFSLLSVAFAQEENHSDVESIKWNSEYGFMIQEYWDDDFTVTRTYSSKNNIETDSEINMIHFSAGKDENIEIKMILSELGMDDAIISDMNEEELCRYANAEQIVVTVSYIKTDVDGNNTYVSEEEALANADDIETILSATADVNSDGDGSFEDSYMRITLAVSHLGGERYHHSADAQWLTMPNYRLTDSLGICVHRHQEVWGTCEGNISYTRVNSIKGTQTKGVEDLSPNAFVHLEKNEWYGIAATFDLKNNWVFGDKFYDYKAHIEFDSVVEHPDFTLNFNVVGSYDHLEKSVKVDSTSLSIDSTGAFGISIGFSIEDKHTRRNVCISEPIKYVPN